VQLIMVLDASMEQSIGTDGIVTSGPIASDISGKHLSVSYSRVAGEWPKDPNLFGKTLSRAFSAEADFDQDGKISPNEINSFLIRQMTEQTGVPPGVRGNWKDAVNPILTLPVPKPVIELPESGSWRPNASPTMRKVTIITGGSMLAASAATYALAWRAHGCLKEPCYNDQDEYDSLAMQRSALLWISRGTGALGAIGVGGGLILQPEGATVSLTTRW